MDEVLGRSLSIQPPIRIASAWWEPAPVSSVASPDSVPLDRNRTDEETVKGPDFEVLAKRARHIRSEERRDEERDESCELCRNSCQW